jgi:hypothetical protein
MLKWHLVSALSIGLCLTVRAADSLQTPRDAAEMLRNDLRVDRKALLAEEMHFTEQESAAFWPIYRDYRSEVDKVTDHLVELVLEYGDLYPNVPEKKASEMLSQYAKIESQLLSVKRKYIKKLAKVLPASKVFRFAQLDNRYDLGVRVGLALRIPILTAEQTEPRPQSH